MSGVALKKGAWMADLSRRAALRLLAAGACLGAPAGLVSSCSRAEALLEPEPLLGLQEPGVLEGLLNEACRRELEGERLLARTGRSGALSALAVQDGWDTCLVARGFDLLWAESSGQEGVARISFRLAGEIQGVRFRAADRVLTGRYRLTVAEGAAHIHWPKAPIVGIPAAKSHINQLLASHEGASAEMLGRDRTAAFGNLGRLKSGLEARGADTAFIDRCLARLAENLAANEYAGSRLADLGHALAALGSL